MNIKIAENTLSNTLCTMKRFSLKYASDLLQYKNYDIEKFFNFVKNLRYVPDPPGFEFVMRPGITVNRGGGDCDDKAVVCASYFILNNITTGFAVVSQSSKPYHHVFSIFIDNDGKLFDFDATYNTSKFLEKKKWVKRKNIIIFRKA